MGINNFRDEDSSKLYVEGSGTGVDAIPVFNEFGVNTHVIFDDPRLTNDELDKLATFDAIYSEIGYKCIAISATKKIGIDEVKELMKGKTTMFSGHSGVGKSTLINVIEPSLNLKTAEISKQHKQGQHTTTFAEMFDYDDKTQIIDTPGIKGFGLVDLNKNELSRFFPEMLKVLKNCKFHNCIHVNEPNCAVIESVEKGEIAFSRYSSYTQMMEEDSPYRN